MRKEGFEKIAEGHKLIQEGYLLLAEENLPEGDTSTQTEKTNAKKESQKVKATKEEAETVTVEDVRAVLAVKTRDGKTQQVKALLNQFGAEKLSSVPEDKLADLKIKAEVL